MPTQCHTSNEDVPIRSVKKLRYPTLDGLRAIAILLVVTFHCNDYISDSLVYVKAAIGTGWNGVYLFFVLSGFLIGSLTIREVEATGTIRVRRFWARRFFRTWPVYYVLLVILVLKEMAAGGEVQPSLWHFLTFTQNFHEVVLFTPTWSLAVEEQFYIALPLVAMVLIRLRSRSIGCIVMLAVGIGFPSLFRALWGESALLVAVMDSLVVGLAIALLQHYHPKGFARAMQFPIVLLIVGLFVVYLPFFTTGHFRQTFRLGLEGVGFGLILLSALSEDFPPQTSLEHSNARATRPDFL